MDAKAEGRLRGVAEDLHRTSDFGKQTTESIRKAGCSASRPTQLRSSAQPRTRDDSSALPHGRRALSAAAAGPCTGRLRGGRGRPPSCAAVGGCGTRGFVRGSVPSGRHERRGGGPGSRHLQPAMHAAANVVVRVRAGGGAAGAASAEALSRCVPCGPPPPRGLGFGWAALPGAYWGRIVPGGCEASVREALLRCWGVGGPERQRLLPAITRFFLI